MPYETTPLRGMYQEYRATSLFVITGISEELAWTIYNQLQSTELFQYFGVELGLGSRVGHGKKQESRLTLRTRKRNSGAVIKVIVTLLWMNFEEESVSPIYLDGSTATRSLWRLKEGHAYLAPNGSGLLPMQILETGTLKQMKKLKKLY